MDGRAWWAAVYGVAQSRARLKQLSSSSSSRKWVKCFPGGSDSKESACNMGDLSSIPGFEMSLEEVMATHSSILAWRILMDRGTWLATTHKFIKSQTRLSNKAHRKWIISVIRNMKSCYDIKYTTTLKNAPSTQKTQVWSLGREDPLRRKRQPTSVFLPG